MKHYRCDSCIAGHDCDRHEEKQNMYVCRTYVWAGKVQREDKRICPDYHDNKGFYRRVR